MSFLHGGSTKVFKGRHFNHEIIALGVRWYVTSKLSYRDLVEMMAERHVVLAHTTIMTLHSSLTYATGLGGGTGCLNGMSSMRSLAFDLRLAPEPS